MQALCPEQQRLSAAASQARCCSTYIQLPAAAVAPAVAAANSSSPTVKAAQGQQRHTHIHGVPRQALLHPAAQGKAGAGPELQASLD